MFPIQMSGQRDKLVGALGAVRSNGDQLDNVVPFLEQLVVTTVASVLTGHYNPVGGQSAGRSEALRWHVVAHRARRHVGAGVRPGRQGDSCRRRAAQGHRAGVRSRDGDFNDEPLDTSLVLHALSTPAVGQGHLSAGGATAVESDVADRRRARWQLLLRQPAQHAGPVVRQQEHGDR